MLQPYQTLASHVRNLVSNLQKPLLDQYFYHILKTFCPTTFGVDNVFGNFVHQVFLCGLTDLGKLFSLPIEKYLQYLQKPKNQTHSGYLNAFQRYFLLKDCPNKQRNRLREIQPIGFYNFSRYNHQYRKNIFH